MRDRVIEMYIASKAKFKTDKQHEEHNEVRKDPNDVRQSEKGCLFFRKFMKKDVDAIFV